jgi:hypothetical protein
VEEEASNIWCSDSRELKPLVKCFISIGTGHPGKKVRGRFPDIFISCTLNDLFEQWEDRVDIDIVGDK